MIVLTWELVGIFALFMANKKCGKENRVLQSITGPYSDLYRIHTEGGRRGWGKYISMVSGIKLTTRISIYQ